VQNGAVSMRIAAAILALAIVGVPQPPAKKPVTPAPEARIDINHATIPELMKVPGMTVSWAGRIVRFRPYRTKQDLLDHGVVTSQVFDRIRDYVIAHRDK
jgi:DNA uptake protein ComE-like DNA-binding protein